MSKIFIAGHTGLLGSAIYDKFKQFDIVTISHKNLDLKDYEKLKTFIKENNVSYIINCAGVSGGIMKNKNYPADLFYENIAITNNIFRTIVDCDIKKIINFSSSCIYPKNSLQPIKEEYLSKGEMEETSIGYSGAKLAGVLGTIAYNKQYNKKILTLIPNTIYGPKSHFDENAHVLTALIKKFIDAKNNDTDVVLWGNGEVFREFIYVEDVADAVLFAYKNFENIKEDYLNIGSGEEINIKQLAEIIKNKVGFKKEILWDTSKPNGVKRKLLDSSKFRGYGWKSIVSLEDGIQKTIKWYEANER